MEVSLFPCAELGRNSLYLCGSFSLSMCRIGNVQKQILTNNFVNIIDVVVKLAYQYLFFPLQGLYGESLMSDSIVFDAFLSVSSFCLVEFLPCTFALVRNGKLLSFLIHALMF